MTKASDVKNAKILVAHVEILAPLLITLMVNVDNVTPGGTALYEQAEKAMADLGVNTDVSSALMVIIVGIISQVAPDDPQVDELIRRTVTTAAQQGVSAILANLYH